jgi:putative peptide zinc metalloprotease protein
VTAYPEDACVALYDLSIQAEDSESAVVGRVATGTFISIPLEGSCAIRWLSCGMTIGEMQRRFKAKFGAELDLDDFLATLCDLGFVRAIGSQPVNASETHAGPSGWQFFTHLQASRVRWLLSGPMKAFYWSMWVILPVLLLARRDAMPVPRDAVSLDSPMLNFVVLTLLGWVLLALHETAHVLAARALDCQTYLSLGHRLHFLVAQTDMTSVRTRPREDRYGPYLAGLTWDITLLLACVSLRSIGFDFQLLRSVAFLTLAAIVFQFAVFMRTDMYFVISNYLRVDNLMTDTRKWISNAARSAAGRPSSWHDLSNVPERARRLLPWYALFCVIGVAVALLEFMLLGLPVLTSLVGAAFRCLRAGPGSTSFWHGTAFLTTLSVNIGLLATVIWQNALRPQFTRLRRRVRDLPVQ